MEKMPLQAATMKPKGKDSIGTSELAQVPAVIIEEGGKASENPISIFHPNLSNKTLTPEKQNDSNPLKDDKILYKNTTQVELDKRNGSMSKNEEGKLHENNYVTPLPLPDERISISEKVENEISDPSIKKSSPIESIIRQSKTPEKIANTADKVSKAPLLNIAFLSTLGGSGLAIIIAIWRCVKKANLIVNEPPQSLRQFRETRV